MTYCRVCGNPRQNPLHAFFAERLEEPFVRHSNHRFLPYVGNPNHRFGVVFDPRPGTLDDSERNNGWVHDRETDTYLLISTHYVGADWSTFENTSNMTHQYMIMFNGGMYEHLEFRWLDNPELTY